MGVRRIAIAGVRVSVKTVCLSVEAVKLLDQAAPSATKMEGGRGSNKQFEL